MTDKQNSFESMSGPENSSPKIETIKTPEGAEASYLPERGGIITSLKLKGKEILYMDEDTLLDVHTNVKGGIPILFPNAGPLKGGEYPNLKQHGFARNASRWETEETESEDSFKETLKADEATKEAYPYDFRLSVSGKFEADSSFTLLEEAENAESGKEMPVAMGLHPYFRVSHDAKRDIKFNFEGGEEIEARAEDWSNGKSISIDNPKVKDPAAVMEIVIPSLGTLTMDVSAEYKKIWVWSLPEKDFFCVEPVMRNSGGLVNDPEMVKPGDALSARVNLSLEG